MATAPDTHQPERVTTLELFFDLVFVFTLTQLTTVLFEAPNGRGLLEVVLMLVVIWWMYGGYAWLTNAVSADTPPRRLLLFAAMGAYFVLALSIPKAFDGTGLAFGIAYLLVVVHAQRALHARDGCERRHGRSSRSRRTTSSPRSSWSPAARSAARRSTCCGARRARSSG